MHTFLSIQSGRLPTCDRCTGAASWEGSFATVAMTSLHPLLQQSDEEELYMCFEQAIRGRVLTESGRPSRPSRLLHSTLEQSVATTKSLVEEAVFSMPLSPSQVRQQCGCSGSLSWWDAGWLGHIRLACLALLLLLVGFDVMGLLVLYAR
jgi:hypothetical protein